MPNLPYGQLVRRQTELMNRMMVRLGVNPAVAATLDGSLAWHEACTKCLFCPHVPHCCSWLEGVEPQDGPTEFCPNMAFFQDCLSEILKHRPIVPTEC
jgi:Family of unknown function (DUF6455)